MKSAKNLPQTIKKSLASGTLAVDFGEEKTVPTECREKCLQMMSFASQNVLMLMIHLSKKSAR